MGGLPTVTMEDALAFLDEMKRECGPFSETYSGFLDVFKAFKARALDVQQVALQVARLLRGHPALLSGFSKFLPLGYSMENFQVLEGVGEQATNATAPFNLTIDDALAFLIQLKQQFGESSETFTTFLSTLDEHKAQAIGLQEVASRVASLLRGHPALLREFERFLPREYSTQAIEMLLSKL